LFPSFFGDEGFWDAAAGVVVLVDGLWSSGDGMTMQSTPIDGLWLSDVGMFTLVKLRLPDNGMSTPTDVEAASEDMVPVGLLALGIGVEAGFLTLVD
jgi:hypothetical protein